jgi:hypothetical protein
LAKKSFMSSEKVSNARRRIVFLSHEIGGRRNGQINGSLGQSSQKTQGIHTQNRFHMLRSDLSRTIFLKRSETQEGRIFFTELLDQRALALGKRPESLVGRDRRDQPGVDAGASELALVSSIDNDVSALSAAFVLQSCVAA